MRIFKPSRRTFLRSLAASSAVTVLPSALWANKPKSVSLFDGRTLDGWKMVPRLSSNAILRDAKKAVNRAEISELVREWHRKRGTSKEVLNHKGDWKVVDGCIVGGQKPAGSGLGAYLMSEKTYGDFELELEANPDWPIDTGILLRQHEIGTVCFQVLVDFRPSGGVGGIFTNGLGSYLATSFFIDGDEQPGFKVANLRPGGRDGNFSQGKLSDAASFEQFKAAWRLDDWNRFRIRCVGARPRITTWINDLKMGEIDTGNPGIEGYDPKIIDERVGPRGHIGFEVHDNGTRIGRNRWAPGAVSRWRNIRITEL